MYRAAEIVWPHQRTQDMIHKTPDHVTYQQARTATVTRRGEGVDERSGVHRFVLLSPLVMDATPNITRFVEFLIADVPVHGPRVCLTSV